jgi:1-deoxyxylulose-5-phosphate synthase
MKYRKLGDSDLNVSEISLGSWLTYGVGVERDRAVTCVTRAFELGINFIDTANAYGRGSAESFLGEVLAGRARASYVLATKLYSDERDRQRFVAQASSQTDRCVAPALASGLRRSLSMPSLRHCSAIEETMQALTEVVKQGKARTSGSDRPPRMSLRLQVASPRALMARGDSC